jgi:DNA-binding response OmpR family regulator
MAYQSAMGKKILFVDDMEEWRSMVGTFLRENGYDVLTASDGSEALAKIEGVRLGLIILDLNLAGESGVMLMRFLKRNHPQVPILLYTGMEHDDGTVRAMLRDGADQYLKKGSMEELLKAVRISCR